MEINAYREVAIIHKNKATLVVGLMLVMLLGLGGHGTVLAETMPIGVKAILPENQLKQEVTYFHLKMKPGQRQTLEVQLFNSSKKDVVVEVSLTAATTNDGGDIDYNLPEKDFDESLRHPFPTLAQTPNEVTVPATGEVTTAISLEMPTKEYAGIILGGINIKLKPVVSEKKTATETNRMQIENQMNYSIGVLLVEDETPVKTELALGNISAGQVMKQNVTKATLRNPTAAIVENLTVVAKIYAKGSDELLFEEKKAGYRMAPNSSFDFGIDMDKEPYQAGTYRLELTATSAPDKAAGGKKQTWTFEEEFTIQQAEVETLNQSSDVPKSYTVHYVLLGSVVVLLIVALVVFGTTSRRQAVSRSNSTKGSSKNK